MRAFIIAALLLLTSCIDRRTPTQQGAEWFRPYGQEAKAACVIFRESSGQPDARTGSSFGLFQIHRVHAAEFQAVTGKPFFPWIYNAPLNGQFALWLWLHEGWRPWVLTEPRCR